MTDTSCACPQFDGRFSVLSPCGARATQEDLLCDPCREFSSETKGGNGKGHGAGSTVTSPHWTFTVRNVQIGPVLA